jgi:hypothetical protein
MQLPMFGDMSFRSNGMSEDSPSDPALHAGLAVVPTAADAESALEHADEPLDTWASPSRLGKAVQNTVELIKSPGLRRVATIDLFEGKHDPAALAFVV